MVQIITFKMNNLTTFINILFFQLNMNPDELVEGALTLLIGGYVLWEMLKSLVNSDPGFGQVVGGAILSAFLIGVAAWSRSK